MVRLKGVNPRFAHGLRNLFQFHSGSIKSPRPPGRRSQCRGFNSIVVRLKAILPKAFSSIRHLFQFHSGSIKSRDHFETSDALFQFQFHSGSIKSRLRSVFASAHLSSFNSIVVRLKGSGRGPRGWTWAKFQFHSGSIKSRRSGKIRIVWVQFQFHSGSIKSRLRLRHRPMARRVSIP